MIDFKIDFEFSGKSLNLFIELEICKVKYFWIKMFILLLKVWTGIAVIIILLSLLFH